MDKIILVEGSDLEALKKHLAQGNRLRVHVEGDQVKFKVGGGMWSPPMGFLDPECFAAQQIPEISEADEPKICWCGKHYVGAECNHAVSLREVES